MLDTRKTRSFAAHAVTLAGLWICAAASAVVSPAHGQCRDPQDRLAAAQSDPRYPALQQAVDRYFAARHPVEGFTGVSVLVSSLSAEQPALHITRGSTSLQDGKPICPDTLFRIGSITKSFTAVLVLQLEAAGVLDLHDPLGNWLPEYPAWSHFTIEQMLHMTSPLGEGYTDDPAFQRDVVADIHRTFRPGKLISYVYPGTGAPQPPWLYSNTNYVLAARIIAKATGTSYAGALKKGFLSRFGCTTPTTGRGCRRTGCSTRWRADTTLKPLQRAASPCEPPPVQALLGQDVKTMNLSSDHGGGGLVASLPDVARWIRALFSDTLLPPRQQTELFSLVSTVSGQPIATTSPADPGGFALGIGQAWLGSTATPVWHYEGATLGYRVGWFRRPGDDLIVVIGLNSLATGADDQLGSLYATVLDISHPKAWSMPGGAAPTQFDAPD